MGISLRKTIYLWAKILAFRPELRLKSTIYTARVDDEHPLPSPPLAHFCKHFRTGFSTPLKTNLFSNLFP